MKKLLFVIIIILSVNRSFAQIDSLIYGITAVTSPEVLYLSKIDPQSGVVTNVSSNPVAYQATYNGCTIDPRNHIFYLTLDSVLLKFDLSTGNLINAIALSLDSNTRFFGICYNSRDTNLYGILYNIPGQSVKFAKINPYNGSITQISGYSIGSSYKLLTSTALDLDHNIFYFETTHDSLIGVDIGTGLISSKTKILANSGYLFGPKIYNCLDSTIYGLYGNMGQGRKFAKIDPASGIITTISPNIIANALVINPATLDEYNGIYYYTGADTTFDGVDIHTGELVTSPHIIIPYPNSYFTNFYYNFSCLYEGPTGVNNIKTENHLEIYPNPADEYLNMHVMKNYFDYVEIIDMTGKIRIKSEISKNDESIKIDISYLGNGLYTIAVFKDTEFEISRFIINR